MSAPATTAYAPTPSADGKTALDHAIEADEKHAIHRFLYGYCRRRGVHDADAEDAVGETFRLAFQRERGDDPDTKWRPALEAPELHLVRILNDTVLKARRRRALKKPTSELGEDEQLPSEEPSAELVLAEEEQERIRAKAVRDALAAETQSGLTVRILDALREGIVGHEKLAEHLKCSLSEVRAGFRRIKRRAAGFAEQLKKDLAS